MIKTKICILMFFIFIYILYLTHCFIIINIVFYRNLVMLKVFVVLLQKKMLNLTYLIKSMLMAMTHIHYGSI